MAQDTASTASTNLVVSRLLQRLPVAALGIRCSRTPDIARIAKASGHHAIWVDLEHSSIAIDAAVQICAAALDIGLMPFVRVPEREYGVIGRLLDGGAGGIIAPRIETVAQAEDLVAACRFPPLGHRSAIGTLPHVGYRKMTAPDFNAAMNRATAVKVLIESPLGIANIEGIAAVPGIDIVGIGTNDLSAELGVAGDFRHARVRAAHDAALAACLRVGKPLAIGGIADAAYSAELMHRGAAPFLMTGIDTDLLLAAAHERVRLALASLESTEPK
ncbi:HpcH/HpaI aldolase family protein [Variovorax sp. PAMC26660]|uniref:HpcH/HpaI aldolase family protein n=1 Tax=Variovorax sp. PAMC26660 TaxID=2762322 RepID=UPI00164EC308|nr:aldolase/citrate lyase family protein [Variovorax sp. PAMC26660]QNK69289.1 aldolase [Variovorax sp. PAMC26660]